MPKTDTWGRIKLGGAVLGLVSGLGLGLGVPAQKKDQKWKWKTLQ
jgi:hypothetical protein